MRSTRVLLVTDRHVAYMTARHAERASYYRPKWILPVAELQNLSGKRAPLHLSWRVDSPKAVARSHPPLLPRRTPAQPRSESPRTRARADVLLPPVPRPRTRACMHVHSLL